jgi:hypothetical protein
MAFKIKGHPLQEAGIIGTLSIKLAILVVRYGMYKTGIVGIVIRHSRSIRIHLEKQGKMYFNYLTSAKHEAGIVGNTGIVLSIHPRK